MRGNPWESGQRTLRRRRRRTESVEGATRTGRSGCCATPPVSEGGRRHHSTGSPFGHHPRLSMGCPRWGQWVSTWSILRGLSSAHHEISMYLSVDTLSHALTTAAACTDNASRGGAPCVTAGDTRRANPWESGQRTLRRRRRRTESVEGAAWTHARAEIEPLSPTRKNTFFVVTLSRGR